MRHREATRVKDEFIATVSDELHAPLATMRGFLDAALAEGGALTAEQRRFVTASLRNAESLLRVVDDLVLLALIEAGALTVELEAVDMVEVAAEAVEIVRPAADEEGVTLELDTHGVPTLHGDRARLVQLLRNVIAQAIQATPRLGRVDVGAETVGSVVVLTVTHTGAATAPTQVPFFRTARTERSRVIADGLAFPIATGIAAAHGGSLTVSGTTVRVDLPA